MLKKINKLLFIIFVIQLPVVAYKFRLYGINELTIGTYASHGGGLTAIIPIVALGYLAGYYYFYERRFSYILLAAGFILFGIVGEKRVLLFIYPIAFMGIYYLVYIVGEKRENIIKKIGVMACIAVLSIVVSVVIIKYHHGYNYPEGAGGKIDFFRALKFAKEYETMRRDDQVVAGHQIAAGRFAMTQLAFELISKHDAMLFGFGPGSTTKSVVSKTRGLDKRLLPVYQSYGMTGLAFVLIEYGLLGLIALGSVFLVLSYRCWNWFKYEKVPYWKAFAMGTLVFAVYSAFIFFCYSNITITDDTITPVYFYAMAVMYVKMKEMTHERKHYEAILNESQK